MRKQFIPGFVVAGLSALTNNAAEMSGADQIPRLWNRFLSSPPVPNKVGDETYSVYTNYESDHTGNYTIVIGSRVSSADHLPEEVTAVEIPQGCFAVITSEQGPVFEIVPAVWRKIWDLCLEELEGTRSFKTDFEVYDHRAANPSTAQIDVFLSLQE